MDSARVTLRKRLIQGVRTAPDDSTKSILKNLNLEISKNLFMTQTKKIESEIKFISSIKARFTYMKFNSNQSFFYFKNWFIWSSQHHNSNNKERTSNTDC